MTQILPNPATKLRTQLVSAASSERARSNASTSEVWAAVWQVNIDSAQFAQDLRSTLELTRSVRTAIEDSAPQLVEMVGRRMAMLEARLVADLRNPWQPHWKQLEGDATLDLLEMAAVILDDADIVKLVVKDAESLIDTLSTLLVGIDELSEVELSGPEKRKVRRYLQRVIRVLANSRLAVSDDLYPVFEGAADAVLGDHTLVEKLLKTPIGTAVLSALVALKLFSGAGEIPRTLPTPNVDVVVVLESACYSPLELGPGHGDISTTDSTESTVPD